MAIELFGCAGGMALGFQRAGINFQLSIDQDPDACASYERNVGHRPVEMDAKDLLRMLQLLEPRPIDLLVADHPCTPWSRAGKRRGLDDERDMLRETVAMIRALRPRCWLIGNVPGLDDGPNCPIVQKVIGSLSPQWCIDYAKLDAADYGVPQHRVRPFWFGHTPGLDCLRWPAPTHGDPYALGHAELGETRKPWVTCRQALANLSPEDLGQPITVRRPTRGNHRVVSADEVARTLTSNTHGDGALLLNDKHPINMPDAPSMTVTTKGNGRGAQGACVMEWPWDRPATTVLSDPRIPPPGHHGGSFLSALDRPSTGVNCRGEAGEPGRNGRKGISQSVNAIKLSERAGAILQGFPEHAVFSGDTKRARWSQIGMAMPPGLAEPVARSIARWFQLAEQAKVQAP